MSTASAPDTPAGRRLAETLAFFEYLEALMERWRAHREQHFGRG